MKTRIIAAYPCLGKTTLSKINRDTIFDREFNESRSIKGMSLNDKKEFFDLCTRMIELQYNSNNYNIIFITEDDEILSRLLLKNIEIELVFPDINNKSTFEEYKNRVINRSGLEWWNRIIEPELSSIKERIDTYQKNTLVKLYLTKADQYIEDVIELPNFINKVRG